MKSPKLKLAKKVIQPALTVGEKLLKARQKAGIDLIEAESTTLVRAKYLEAIEQSQFYELPLPVYTYGFIQTYAQFLGLNPKKILLQFQGEYGVAHKISVNSLEIESKVQTKKVVITPRFVWASVCVAAVAAFALYIGTQIYGFAALPPLTVNSPAQLSEVSSDSINVVGKTAPGVAVAISGQKVDVDEQGNFSQSVRLQPGTNTFVISAITRAGKTISVSRSIKDTVPSQASINQPNKDANI